MSLNAWPSHKMELYDGWILRFSYFYTHRTNSVEQFGNSTLPWREKVAYCEDVYKRLGSPAIFKISPLVSPDFDYTLENRGYEIQHVTEVMTLHLSDARLDAPYSAVTITDEIPDIWITSLFDLKGMTNPIHRAVVPSMYRAIPKETICASIWNSFEAVLSLILYLEFIKTGNPHAFVQYFFVIFCIQPEIGLNRSNNLLFVHNPFSCACFAA